MRKVLIAVAFVFIAYATPALACKQCRYQFVWPQLEECAFCDDVWCGHILCHIEQGTDPSDGDHCVFDGDDCDEKGGGCGPPTVSRLDKTWRLTRVEVTLTVQRPVKTRVPRKS